MAALAYAPVHSSYGIGSVISRPQSVAYMAPHAAYSHGVYSDPLLHSYTSGPYTSYEASRSSTSLVPLSRRLTNRSYNNLLDYDYPGGQLAPALGSMPLSVPRHRRRSSVSFVTRPPMLDQYRLSGSHQIKFKRRGAFSAGITLAEAQSHIRLSNNDHYTLRDLNADGRDTILLTVRWTGYAPMSYEIPLDSYSGRLSLQTLSRRVARACVHYLQSNMVPIMWDRVEIHHIEEIGMGVWQPMLRAI
ncbi:hypothetical protein F5887DRAFT_197490 [Amanita rubescens]|nr:hypothetical protein F5887DRAFT_197490 [Amanita rubescens]